MPNDPKITIETIHKAIADRTRPRHERLIIEWQYREHLGGFRSALWRAIEVADDENLKRLARAYPDEVNAVKLFRTTWIKDKLQKEGLC